MSDEPVTNPTDRDGVPLHGPMADHVNTATGYAMKEQQARFMAEGRLRPEMVRAAVRRAREDAIAVWLAQHEGPKAERPTSEENK